jgi:hypothetical protein
VSGRDQGTPIPDHEGPLPGKVITGDAQEGLIEPGDRPRAADRFGTTAEEQREGASLDERIRWEQPDFGADSEEESVEAAEFAPGDEFDVDPYDLDQGSIDREHPAPIVDVEGSEGFDRRDPDSLGPAPDAFGAATRLPNAHEHELEHMTDDELHKLVDTLVDEREQALQRGDHDGSAGLDIELDQLWDLLRQRRALRDAGADPSSAHARPTAIVEGYEQ